MKRFTISRDDRYHEGWPSICQATNGDLVCSYAEADQHGGGAVPSAVVCVSSDDGVYLIRAYHHRYADGSP